MGAAVAGGLRDAGGGYPEGQLPSGMAGGRSPLGREQAAGDRGSDRSAQGPLRFGAPPREDPRRSAGPAGREGGRLHLRAAAQRPSGEAPAPPSRPVGLNDYASAVLGLLGSSSALAGFLLRN